MLRLLPVLCGLLLIAAPVLAQDGLGPGRRPKSSAACMTDPELEAEAIVRAGLAIRDHARACARRGHDGSIVESWSTFDGANADAFRAAVQRRTDAYKRNYPDDPYAEQRATNGLVASRQLQDFAPEECIALRDLVDRFVDWPAFMRHVRMVELGQVKNSIKRCPTKRRAPGG